MFIGHVFGSDIAEVAGDVCVGARASYSGALIGRFFRSVVSKRLAMCVHVGIPCVSLTDQRNPEVGHLVL